MKKIVLVVIVILAVVLWLKKDILIKQPETASSPTLTVASTNPNPLDGATVLPTQNLEFTFNKPLFRSEFKHRFDPEIEHEVDVVGGPNKEFGSTFRIIFKEPLELGAGYTLFILGNTHTEDKTPLDHEYVYHFSTIKYRGI